MALIVGGLPVKAQMQDRMWCFGIYCGIDFRDTSNPQHFYSKAFNALPSASIADTQGTLVFYTSCDTQHLFNSSTIDIAKNQFAYNGTHKPVKGIDSFFIWSGASDGSIILPVDTFYYVVSSTGLICIYKYFPQMDSIQVDTFIGNLSGIDQYYPIISAVRQANGKDWWLVLKIQDNITGFAYIFEFYRVDSDGVHFDHQQTIGRSSALGEIRFSPSGNRLVTSAPFEIDLFDFDRCTGYLSNLKTIEQDNNTFWYGSEFSADESKLYITTSHFAGDSTSWNYVLQYDLYAFDITNSKKILFQSRGAYLYGGQLQLAPDNKIYYSIYDGSNATVSDTVLPPLNDTSVYLSVITNPNLAGLACNFQPFSFYLGDSARTTFSLPNNPNYILGPLLNFIAPKAPQPSAAACPGDTLLLGPAALFGCSYDWQGANVLNPNAAQTKVVVSNLSQDYYLTITDTTTLSSCNVRIDTVHVPLQTDCIVSVPIIIPSLVGSESWHFAGIDSVQIVLMYNTLGQIALLKTGVKQDMDLGILPSAMYFYQIELNSGEIISGKLLKQ